MHTDKDERGRGNLKGGKCFWLVLLFVILLISISMAHGAQRSELFFSDEGEILQESVKEKLEIFNTEHRHPVAVFVRKKSLKETQQNHLEDALRVFEQQKRKAQHPAPAQQSLPAFLLYYNMADRIVVMAQQKEKILEDEKIQVIQNKYQEQKKVLKGILPTEEEEIKKSANTLITLLLSDLMEEIDKKEQEEKQFEQQQKQRGDNPCSPLKDGICDITCGGVDLDCWCGDGVCQYHENGETCAKDCGEQRSITCSIITDGLCAGNCITKDIDCYFEELAERAFRYGEIKKISAKVMTQIFLALIVLFSLVFLILIQIIHLKHERERQKQTLGKDDFIQRLLRYQEKESEQLIQRDIKKEKKDKKKNDKK